MTACVLVVVFVLATYSDHSSAQASAESPKPITLMMCKDSNSARNSFENKYMLEIKNGDFKITDLSKTCEEVTVMSNDFVFLTNFSGLGDIEFKKKYPIAFELAFVDEACERQCLNKAEGWVSSYELPLELWAWPNGEEWVEARANRLSMDSSIDTIVAANRMLASIQDYPVNEQRAMYDRGQEAVAAGLRFMRNYGF